METSPEKRGPIEKGEKGWPINPFGVVILLVFAVIAILFIIRPLLSRTSNIQISSQSTNSTGGRIISPNSGEIVKSNKLGIELSVDELQKVQKVQFWVHTYSDGKWQMIGEAQESPYKLDWQIPAEIQNRAIAITAHIYQKDGNVIKDPGGWKEGIIILSN